jgi:sn-glycerol 3-phosphate transport system ATP-binding protein
MTGIQLDQVSGRYQDGRIGLQPTDLVIEPGELVAVVGPSGSGKTTLIRLIAGLDRPATGTLRFDGKIMNGVGPGGRDVAMVVVQGALYDHMNTEQNIRFPLKMAGIGEPEQTERIRAEADRFRIRRLLGRRPRALSAGERQLVATGRATVRDASILLFDEALAGVDPHLRNQIRDEFRRLHNGSQTIVYATNDQEEAMALADRLIVLNRGVVQQVGVPLALYGQPINVFVAEFLGSPGVNVVPGQVVEGRLRLGTDDIAGAPPPPQPGGILVGIRPEDVQLARPGDPFERCLHARVTAVEMLGSVRIAHVAFGTPDSGAVDFAVRVTDSRPVFTGDSVELLLTLDRISYFDPVSGLRL